MVEKREAAAHTPGAARGGTPQGKVSAADRERVLLLECRLEALRSALDEARDQADRARNLVAESSAREADHARRFAHLHEQLANARSDVAELHRRIERSEAIRTEMEGHLFEGGAHTDIEELVRLRRDVLSERERANVSEESLGRLRMRVEELRTSREMVLARVSEWTRLVRDDDPEAADLAEFIAELRGEILELDRRGTTAESREALLRERLARLGVDPDGDPAEDAHSVARALSGSPEADEYAEEAPEEAAEAEVTELAAAQVVATEAEAAETLAPAAPEEAIASEAPADPTRYAPATRPAVAAAASPPRSGTPEPQTNLLQGLEQASAHPEPRAATASNAPLAAELAAANAPGLRAELLLRLGRSGDLSVVEAILPWTGWTEPTVRAAAYEALGRLLEKDPEALEPHLRAGLADPDARVRRRVVLTAATARKLALRPLLATLLEDPDAQVRRVVREVMRQAPPATDKEALGDTTRRPGGESRLDEDPARFRAASGSAS